MINELAQFKSWITIVTETRRPTRLVNSKTAVMGTETIMRRAQSRILLGGLRKITTTESISEGLVYLGNGTEDDVVEDIFGDATLFAQALENATTVDENTYIT